MMKRARIFAAGLALSLLLTQTAYADVLISPLDPGTANQGTQAGTGNGQGTANGQGQTGIGNQQGPQVESGLHPGMDNQPTAPGYVGEPGLEDYHEDDLNKGMWPGMDKETEANQSQTSQSQTSQNQPSQTPPTQETQAPAQKPQPSVNLPAAPVIEAPAGILYDVTNDRILFEKDADTRYFPASITKLMTALLVVEKADLNGTVTFSKTATTNLESGAVTLNLTEGDKVSVKDCLYGLLLKSANEVANGLAEHVGGSIAGFADLMNKKAAELGCTGTHFVNPNGLNDPDHYTNARDMARIARAAFENPTICEILSTMKYTFPATKKADARTITPGHKMLYENDSRYYPGIVGGKTGYTSLAGNTLVTCAEQNGTRLIAVILKAKSTQYTDTKLLLDYGFAYAAAEKNAGVPGTGSGQQTGQSAGQNNQQTSQPTGQNRWIQDGNIWRFEFADGSRAVNCLATIDGAMYYFNADGQMMTGWQSLSGEWYYFKESGSMMRNGWAEDGGKWFFLDANGRITRNAWIDNQYYVGADGIWVTDAVPDAGGAA